MEVSDSDKQTRLQYCSANYDRKKFNGTSPETERKGKKSLFLFFSFHVSDNVIKPLLLFFVTDTTDK